MFEYLYFYYINIYISTYVSDFRQANEYSFDADTGLLSNEDGDALLQSGDVYFGPFFEPSAANKNNLKCDYDSSQVCTWKVYQNIDVFYRYSTGENSIRASLIDSEGKGISPSKPGKGLITTVTSIWIYSYYSYSIAFVHSCWDHVELWNQL